MFTLYWIRADGQGDYNMGDYPTRDTAEAAIPAMTTELIEQCPGPHVETNADFTKCRDEILDGKWSIDEAE